MAVNDPCGDLNYVCLLAIDDQPDENLACALERLFSYRLRAKPVSDALMDKLSGKPFHAQLKRPPSEYLVDTIDRLKDWIWHHIDVEKRHLQRVGSLPKIVNPPTFKMKQLLGMKNVVADWVHRNPIDFALLSDAIKVENALRRIVENPTSLDSGGSPINPRTLVLVELMRKDDEQRTLGKTTKSPERQIAYRRLCAAKHDQPEIYADAAKQYEAKKKG